MSAYSHDPVINAELTAIAEDHAAPPEPHPLDGAFEPVAQAFAARYPHIPASEIAAISTAISLRRLADTLDGTAAGLCVTETIFGRARQ